MTFTLTDIRPRVMALGLVALVSLVAVLVLNTKILPGYRSLLDLRRLTEVKRLELEQLAGLMGAADTVDRRFQLLPPETFQIESDEITLSKFLREIESLARRPGLSIVGAKPGQVEKKDFCKRFPVRVTVVGPLPEVLRFGVELCNGLRPVGLDSVGFRGVRDGQQVECSMAISLIQVPQELLRTELPQ